MDTSVPVNSLYDPKCFLSSLSETEKLTLDKEFKKYTRYMKERNYQYSPIGQIDPFIDASLVMDRLCTEDCPLEHYSTVFHSFTDKYLPHLIYNGFLTIGSGIYLSCDSGSDSDSDSTNDDLNTSSGLLDWPVPMIEYQRTLIPLQANVDFVISKQVRKNSKDYYMTVDCAFDDVMDGCIAQHGIPWMGYSRIRKMYTELHKTNDSRNNCSGHSIELWMKVSSLSKQRYCSSSSLNMTNSIQDLKLDDNSDASKKKTDSKENTENAYSSLTRRRVFDNEEYVLVAGELGTRVGDMYVSLTGFRNKTINGCGSVQMATLAAWLHSCGASYWDMGMVLPYKLEMMGQPTERKEFIRILRTKRDNDMNILQPNLPDSRALEVKGTSAIFNARTLIEAFEKATLDSSISPSERAIMKSKKIQRNKDYSQTLVHRQELMMCQLYEMNGVTPPYEYSKVYRNYIHHYLNSLHADGSLSKVISDLGLEGDLKNRRLLDCPDIISLLIEVLSIPMDD